jgi:fructoselysine 6-phosphate deglycase
MSATSVNPSTSVEPIPSDLESHLRDAVALRDQIDEAIGSAIARGIDSVFFVGCGGSLLSTWPVQYLLERSVPDLAVFHMNANEFVYREPARLGERALVVTGSHTGSTKETVAATQLAVERGASVVSMTKEADSPLAEPAPTVFRYGSPDAKQVVLGQIGWAILEARGIDHDAAAVRAAYDAYPSALVSSLEALEPRLAEIAAALKDEPITYVLGAGPLYGPAATLSMCYLQEMQWMDAAAFNAGEFFHGAFEVVTGETPVILLLGEDETRPMADRAKTFLDTYTEKATYLDSVDLALPGIPTDLRGRFVPSAFYSVVGRLAEHYAAVRGHSLETRRYMTKVEY